MNLFYAFFRSPFVLVPAFLALQATASIRGDTAPDSSSTPPEAGPPSAASLMTPARQHELFEALDLSDDHLKAVREAVAKGDYAAAEHAWADSLRQNPGVGAPYNYRHPVRQPGYTDQVAEDAANGKVTSAGSQIYCTWPDNNINWFYNATGSTPPFDYQWQWQLCRMGFWDNMERAYRATGDERYPQAWTKQLCSFVGECPVPNELSNYPYSAWGTIDAGIRMLDSWPHAYFSFLESPSVSDADIAVYTVSCLDHGRYLRKFNTSGNFLTMEMNGLYTDGCVFPQFKEAKDWRIFAAAQLYQQEKTQFLPDGAQIELSTHYHNVALQNVAGLAHTAQEWGHFDELPADYISRMEDAFAYDLYLMTPDRSLPRFNDSAEENVPADMKRALQFFPHRADFQWVATDGKEGAPPQTTSHYFPWAGFVAMRSGWERDANYGAFRVGPVGFRHWHQDKLDFVVWAYGTQVLFSSEGGHYEESKWRLYAVDTFSNNCIIVDGKAQRQQTKDPMANISKAPIDARWQSTPQYDFASGTYDAGYSAEPVYHAGYGAEADHIATQVRRVLFVKPDLFVVADTLTPNDNASHTYQARWQLLPTQTHQDPTTNEVTTTAPGQPNLAVVPLSPQGLEVRDVSAQTEPELLGWSVRHSVMPQYAPATTVLHTKHGAGVQQFLTLFIPIKAGGPEPVTSVTPKSDTSAVVTLGDGRTLTISADPAPTGNLEVIETLANGTPGRHVVSK